MKKLMKACVTACGLLGIFHAHAQTYVFSSPQGYGSGVTGGGTGPITVVTTRTALETALKASGSARIIVQGSIQVDYMSVEVHDKTLLGLPGSKLFTNDQTAGASGIMNLKSSSNVILRNLTFVGPGAYDSDGRDDLTFDGCSKMWVDHCDFQDGMDGNFDNKGGTDNVTVSWCRFRYLKAPKAGGSGGTDDHRFTNLVGSNDSDKPTDGKFSITWQYCWWDNGCVERMTRARNAQLHMLNCYWNTNTGKVLLGIGGASDVYVENSVFAGSGTKYKYYDNGTVRFSTVGCTAPPADAGSCPKPSYSYEATSASTLVSSITGTCGAGATLTVTTGGTISASCGTTPPVTTFTLTTATTGTGTISLNPAGGTYDDGTVVTVTAVPGTGYVFSGWTGSLTGSTNPTSITMNANKSITATFVQGPTLTTSSSETQSVVAGPAISPIVYMWGGTATGVTVSGLPAGLTGTPNTSAKTYTITGTPTASGTYTISTTQFSGTAATSFGKITLTLATPTNVTASAPANLVTIDWSQVTGATGYVVNLCAPNNGTAPKKQWDFTAPWTITSASADANLVLDTDPSRFNYVPATTNTALTFANGTAIPDVAGLLFTQTGTSKVRLGFGSLTLFLNGANISISIPCAVGDKITIAGPASNTTATDRGYSVTGGTLSTAESSNIDGTGILNVAGATGTWVYTATSTSLKITTVTGGMNIQKISIGGSGTAPICTEYPVAGGSTTTYTIPNLLPSTTYSYQVKATNGVTAEASAYSTSKNITTGFILGVDDIEADYRTKIVLFPNPSLHTFQVGGIEEEAMISVSDINGKQLFSKEIFAYEPISIDDLTSGMYLVKITTTHGTVEKILMKK